MVKASLAGDFFRCLEAAADVVKEFKQRHGRMPSEIEMRTAAQLFAEMGRGGGKRPLRTGQQSDSGAL